MSFKVATCLQKDGIQCVDVVRCMQADQLQDSLPELKSQHGELDAELAALRAQIAEVLLPFNPAQR